MTLGPLHGPGRPDLPRLRVEPHQRDALAALTLVLPTAADTDLLGRRLGSVLRHGDLVVLTGPLGAGKTALTQGIGAGLGVQGRIASPTFVIARVHPGDRPGRPALVHVDAYRLGSLDEVDDLDLDVDITSSVTVVEWGEGMVERLAPAWLSVTLSRAADSEERTAVLEPHHGDWAERLDRLAAGLG
jgi:tRNA threonylcarbamoyladenosine biosynthesis protein TsaE